MSILNGTRTQVSSRSSCFLLGQKFKVITDHYFREFIFAPTKKFRKIASPCKAKFTKVFPNQGKTNLMADETNRLQRTSDKKEIVETTSTMCGKHQ